MSNKDLLVLENEFRDELPSYKEKPKITAVEKPTQLTSRLSSFLTSVKESQNQHTPTPSSPATETKLTPNKKLVEMDIYITPTNEQ